MSLTSIAPLSLPMHPAIDRPPQLSMPQGPADDRNYQGYNFSRAAPGLAHGAPPPDTSSPERLHSVGGNVSYPKSALPPPSPANLYSSPHDLSSAPGSSHGFAPQPQTPVPRMSGTAYPPQSPAPYYGMPPQNPDPAAAPAVAPTAPSVAPTGGAAPRTTYAADGAPIVPVGISGGKMFRCRGFGDCDKVFTRSEHLARHVRKHTGERPFPCHCGKAFSRLDNLRQHAATVHADSTQLNEAMLTSLASVHAALSQRANREQRRRGEVVEVPKNAVERPRGERGAKGTAPPAPGATAGTAVPPPGGVYPPAPGYHHPQQQQWGAPPDHNRPRTAGGSWVEYPYGTVGTVGEHPAPPGTAGSLAYSDDAGPSRRPPSSAGGYPTGYYEQGPPSSSHGRPGTAAAPPGTTPSDDSGAVPYGYRPMSSNGPGHYPESEPPSSAHGPPPHSPMYPHPATVPAAGTWASPPTPHSAYASAEHNLYPPGTVPSAEGHHPYPPGQGQDSHYGPPPPGSSGSYYPYPPQGHGYYGQQSPAGEHQATFAAAPGVPPGTTPNPTGAYPPHYGGTTESPFQYNAGGYPYPPGYDARKRRAEDEARGDRKHPRSAAEAVPPSAEPRAPGAPGEQLWLPPASERRSSLAISALLGSPQQDAHGRSRPGTADALNPGAYPYPPAPYDDRTARERPGDGPDEKPKALVAE